MRLPERSTDPEYFSTMNTTPLIDVLLVLLVMLILTLPTATHKTPLDLPRPGTSSAPPPTHVFGIAASGAYSWDGVAIADAALPAQLAGLVADPAAPMLLVAADGEARYGRFDAALADIRRAGVTGLGFSGNERWRDLSAR